MALVRQQEIAGIYRVRPGGRFSSLLHLVLPRVNTQAYDRVKFLSSVSWVAEC